MGAKGYMVEVGKWFEIIFCFCFGVRCRGSVGLPKFFNLVVLFARFDFIYWFFIVDVCSF